jgi:hypothetical protein
LINGVCLPEVHSCCRTAPSRSSEQSRSRRLGNEEC